MILVNVYSAVSGERGSTHSVLSSLYQFIADQLPHFRPLKQSQRIHRCFLARNCAAITHKSCWIGTRGVSAEKIYVCQDLMACSPQIWLPACLVPVKKQIRWWPAVLDSEMLFPCWQMAQAMLRSYAHDVNVTL